MRRIRVVSRDKHVTEDYRSCSQTGRLVIVNKPIYGLIQVRLERTADRERLVGYICYLIVSTSDASYRHGRRLFRHITPHELGHSLCHTLFTLFLLTKLKKSWVPLYRYLLSSGRR